MEGITPKHIKEFCAETVSWIENADRMGESISKFRHESIERLKHIDHMALEALFNYLQLENIVRELASKDYLVHDIEPDDIHDVVARAVAAVKKMPHEQARS